MKHVFIVHSHTLFLTSLGVIDYLHLDSTDVVFLTFRNYCCKYLSKSYKSVDVSELEKFNWTVGFRKSRLKKAERWADEIIEEHIKENFIAYTPHSSLFNQLFITNDFCEGYNYIQEGITDIFYKHKSIKDYIYLLQTYYLNDKRFYRNRSWIITPNLQEKAKNLKCYVFNPNIFSAIPKEKIVIKWPKLTLDRQFDDNNAAFIIDCWVEQTYLEKKIFENAYENLINNNATDVSYIKFHPAQSDEIKSCVIGIFERHSLKYEILPQDIPFELILCAYPNMKICGFTSSLVYYAKQMGHPFAQPLDLLKKSKKFRKQLEVLECKIK